MEPNKIQEIIAYFMDAPIDEAQRTLRFVQAIMGERAEPAEPVKKARAERKDKGKPRGDKTMGVPA